MESIVNLRMLSNPMNWPIVWAVLLVAGTGLYLVKRHIGTDCGCGNPSQPD